MSVRSNLKRASGTDLRSDAELLLAATHEAETADKVMHELRVHQIELEMQADELRSTENALEESRDRYLDLYEFSPVGYCTVSREGLIVEMNLTGSMLLGIERSRLRQRRIASFIAADDLELWHHHFSRSFKSSDRRHCELQLKRMDGTLFHARLDTLHVESKRGVSVVRIAFTDVTESKLAAIELEKSRRQLRELAARNETIREDERKRIAREVHDELGQLLTALRMSLELQGSQYRERDPALLEATQTMLALTDRIIGEVRNVASNLRPAALDAGLLPALAWLCDEFNKRTTQACTLLIGKRPTELDELSTMALFRIVQESLTNVMRYAEATSVEITITREGDCIVTTVSDDGKGFNTSAAPPEKSFGLLGMRERALAAGGVFEIASKPAQGTVITIRIPVNSAQSL